MSPHVEERLSAYLDDELPAAERAVLDAHLRECDDCTARLAELASVDERARALPAEPPAGYFDSFPSRVAARLGVTARPTWRVPAWAVAAAAALALSVITPLTWRPARPRPAASLAPAASLPPAASPPTAARELKDVPEQAEPPARTPAKQPEQAPSDELSGKLSRLEKSDKKEPAAAEPKAKTGFAAAPQEAPVPAAPAVAAPSAAYRETDAPAAKRNDAGEERSSIEGPRSEAQPVVTGVGGMAQGAQLPDAKAGAGSLVPAAKDVGRAAPRPTKPAASEGEEGLSAVAASSAPRSAGEARRQRDSWRAFARDHGSEPAADEARVKALEAAAEACRLGGDPKELAALRADAAAYLRRKDARLQERVRALLRSLPRE